MISFTTTFWRDQWSVLFVTMAGSVLFIFLITANSISGLFLPLPPPLPGFLPGFPSSSTGRSPPAPAPIWTLWDLASSSTSVLGTVRSKGPVEGTNDYKYDFNIGEKGDENFMAHDERSEGGVVSGSYSYVDPLGFLVTVHYQADDANGYSETRRTEPRFV